ncbi:hypothetical protein PHMEG_00013809, partial [Phytophthora megakarya]
MKEKDEVGSRKANLESIAYRKYMKKVGSVHSTEDLNKKAVKKFMNEVGSLNSKDDFVGNALQKKRDGIGSLNSKEDLVDLEKHQPVVVLESKDWKATVSGNACGLVQETDIKGQRDACGLDPGVSVEGRKNTCGLDQVNGFEGRRNACGLKMSECDRTQRGTLSGSHGRLFAENELDMLEQGSYDLAKEEPEEYDKKLEDRLYPLDEVELQRRMKLNADARKSPSLEEMSRTLGIPVEKLKKTNEASKDVGSTPEFWTECVLDKTEEKTNAWVVLDSPLMEVVEETEPAPNIEQEVLNNYWAGLGHVEVEVRKITAVRNRQLQWRKRQHGSMRIRTQFIIFCLFAYYKLGYTKQHLAYIFNKSERTLGNGIKMYFLYLRSSRKSCT